MITRTSKGSASNKVSGTTLSVASVAIVENASIVVCLGHDPVAVTSVKWNSLDLTKIVEETNGSNVQGSIWALDDCTAATGNVDVVFGSAIDAKAMTVSQLIGETNSSAGGQVATDVFSSAQGSGTSLSSGSTGTLSFKGELAIGALVWEATLANGGTGDFVFTGQIENLSGGAGDSNIALAEYSLVEDEDDAFTLTRTGASPSADWVALVVGFYEFVSQVQVAQEYRTFNYTKDRVEVAQQYRSFNYTNDRVEVQQQYRTFWYIASPTEDEPFALII